MMAAGVTVGGACLTREHGRAGGFGVDGIGLAPQPAGGSVGPDHLDHDLPLATKVTSQGRPVACGSLHPEGLDRA